MHTTTHTGAAWVVMSLFAVLVAYGCSPETGRWQEARQENTVSAYEAFLTEFPDGSFADSARSWISLLEFEATAELHTVGAYEGFLERFPEGPFADSARLEIMALDFAAAAEVHTVASYQAFLERFPEGSLADQARAALDDIYPPFVTDEVLEIASISETVGTGKMVFSAGTAPNLIRAKAISVRVPIVDGKACPFCAEVIEISPNLKVPVTPFFMDNENAQGSSVTLSISVEGPVAEDAPAYIVSGSEGATLKKVGRGFRLVEGEAHLLRG